MDDAIEAVETAFRDVGSGAGSAQPRRRLRVRGGVLHVMSGAVPALGTIAVKAYTTTREGARFVVLTFDAASGQLTGIIEGDKLGQIRTGASSAVATRHMARSDASVLGIIGTGWQARSQIEAICRVRPIRLVRCFSRDSARRESFAREMSQATGVTVEAVDSGAAACQGAHIVATATSAADPVLEGAWLESGTHLNIMGSNSAIKRETDDECIRRSALIVSDDREAARIEGGDLIIAIEKGLINWHAVHDLADVIVGRINGRPTPDSVTFFKSLGSGIEDAAAAAVVIRHAREKGLGVEVPMFAAPPPSRATR
jgi:ornithine cyclodeaminase/alanine dehydrogenase-like protein (mu-crystallin family)